MPQFDVFRGSGNGVYPLVVDVQADLHVALGSRLVVPLISLARCSTKPITRQPPVVQSEATTTWSSSLRWRPSQKTSLTKLMGTLAAHRATLIAALDLLITGS